MSFLSLIFADALEDEVVKKNPMNSRKLSNPSDKKTERKALTKEQMQDRPFL